MSKKDVLAYYEDILVEIAHIGEFTAGILTEEEFSKSLQTVYACARSIEIIGEAAKNVPEDAKAKNPQVPWKQMVGMRDKIIHDYGNMKVAILWKTLKEDIPKIKPIFEKLMEEKDEIEK